MCNMVNLCKNYLIQNNDGNFRNYNVHSLFNEQFYNNIDPDVCISECTDRVDCIDYYYTIDKPVQSKFEKDVDDFHDNYTYFISITYPTEPTVIYEISLKMSFEEYLSLTASIISLWFGFSIIMFTDICQVPFIKYNVYQNFRNIIIGTNCLRYRNNIKLFVSRHGN